jgi:hypothetical protein
MSTTMSRTSRPLPVVRRRRFSLDVAAIGGWVLVIAAPGIWVFDAIAFARMF